MNKIIGYSIFLLVVFSQIPIGLAQREPSTQDVRCIVVASRVSAIPDKDKQAAGKLLTMFYLGRVDAAFPSNQLAAAIEREDHALNASDFRSELSRCSNYLRDRALALDGISKNLQRSAQ